MNKATYILKRLNALDLLKSNFKEQCSETDINLALKYFRASSLVANFFSWDKTKEGYEFWFEISKRIIDIERKLKII